MTISRLLKITVGVTLAAISQNVAFAQVCNPVRYVRITNPNPIELKCGEDVDLFEGLPGNVDVTGPGGIPDGIPDGVPIVDSHGVPILGLAVGRVHFSVANESIKPGAGEPSKTYYWNASVDVGASRINYRIGEDVCPTRLNKFDAPQYMTKHVLGYGKLVSWDNRVKAVANHNISMCTDYAEDEENDGAIEEGIKLVNVTLDVWVEDPTSGCEGSTIQATSFLANNDGTQGEDNTDELSAQWFWPHKTKLINEDIDKGKAPGTSGRIHQHKVDTSNSTGVIVLSSVEATVWRNPTTEFAPPHDQCGLETSAVNAEVFVNDQSVYNSSPNVPASQGIGHVTTGGYTAEPVNQSETIVGLRVSRKFGNISNNPTTRHDDYPDNDDPHVLAPIVTSGGHIGGDAMLVTIKY